MDYYDYGPRVMLERPIALVGFMGSGVRQVAYSMSATLGVPLYDVDRWIEHEAGTSLAVLQLRRGEATRREIEQRMVQRALHQNAPGVIALGDGALGDAEIRRQVSIRTTLVVVERPLVVLRRNLARELAHEPGRFPEFALTGLPGDDAMLQAALQVRGSDYRGAQHRVDAGTLHPRRVARALIERLSLLD